MMNNAIILLSGGLDCVVATAMIRKNYENITAITFNYGQKAFKSERKAAEEISKYYGLKHVIVDIPWLGNISKSSLNRNTEIPTLDKNMLDNDISAKKSADSVWVPNRNALFINIAACFAETQNAQSIIIGANKEEAATFKDNSKNFIDAINVSLENSVKNKVKVIAPLINLTKSDTVRKGIELNVPFEKIFSCYSSDEKHCGKCESCLRLKRAFELNDRHDIIRNIFNGDI